MSNLLKLLSEITTNQSMLNSFINNENVLFKAFNIDEKTQNAFRNSDDGKSLLEAIKLELDAHALPSKVVVKPDYHSAAPVLHLVDALVQNAAFRDVFVSNENGIRDGAAKAYGVNDTQANTIAALIEKKEGYESDLDAVLANIKEELVKIKRS
ncbi:hypothetical protein NI389_14675 [Pseudoalteromonas xiamenensis]|uniref:hypothetical protein n=1 Tax=Pseudoalteromonas xiamenensis TaxID=882626 RepID=UPI0027E40821|nr:hypothetical protein [Pseudoalteromonas xiamenensis]WMN59435.1 hypothetical protein NI389_14675 [Pseudoalteromonas xiamenensis]